jgi:hypothetical protein
MPKRLEGSCRCRAISFSVDGHTPFSYQSCYCSICRKSVGDGGYAINIMDLAETLKVKGKSALEPMLIALYVFEPAIEIVPGEGDSRFDLYCGRHCDPDTYLLRADSRQSSPLG